MARSRFSLLIKLFLLVSLLGLAKTPLLGQEEPALLTLEDFLANALSKHPSFEKLKAGYNEQRGQAQRVLALKELILTASSGLTVIDPVYGGDSISADRSTRFTFDTGISQTYPELGGLTASLSLGNNSSSLIGLDGTKTSSASPYLGLALSLPLLKNFLGSADRLSLKQMNLQLKLIELSEEEAVELLLKNLVLQYYSWSLVSEKAQIYQGFLERANQYYGQVLRRAELGVADQSDLMLARQNWLGYQTSWINARQSLAEQTIRIASLAGVKTEGETNLSFEFRAETGFSNPIDLSSLGNSLSNEIPKLRTVQLARLASEIAKHDLDLAEDKGLPQLNLSIKGTKTASAAGLDQALSSMAGNTFYAGLDFSLPLNNSAAGFSAAAAREAAQKKDAEYHEVILETEASLSQYRLAGSTWKELERVARETTIAAEGRVAAVYTRYQQGRATLNNLTDAQDAWARTQIQALETRYNLRKIELESAALCDLLLENLLPDWRRVINRP